MLGTANSSLRWFINLTIRMQKLFRWLEQLTSFTIKLKNIERTIITVTKYTATQLLKTAYYLFIREFNGNLVIKSCPIWTLGLYYKPCKDSIVVLQKVTPSNLFRLVPLLPVAVTGEIYCRRKICVIFQIWVIKSCQNRTKDFHIVFNRTKSDTYRQFLYKTFAPYYSIILPFIFVERWIFKFSNFLVYPLIIYEWSP
jgi:hypothetical protein